MCCARCSNATIYWRTAPSGRRARRITAPRTAHGHWAPPASESNENQHTGNRHGAAGGGRQWHTGVRRAGAAQDRLAAPPGTGIADISVVAAGGLDTGHARPLVLGADTGAPAGGSGCIARSKIGR